IGLVAGSPDRMGDLLGTAPGDARRRRMYDRLPQGHSPLAQGDLLLRFPAAPRACDATSATESSPDRSSTLALLGWSAWCQACRTAAFGFALEDRPSDMLSDPECFDHIAHSGRPRPCSREIVARLRE